MVEPTNGAKGGNKAGRVIRKTLSTAGETYYNVSIYVFTIAWMATILLGFAGYYQYYQLNGQAITYAALTYDTLKLFVLGGGDLDWSNGYVPVLDIARWMALIVYFWAAALIVSRAFLGPLHRLRLWLCTDHIVVCGMGRIGTSFARALSQDHQVVIIDKEPRSRVDDELKDTGVVYVHGNASEEKVLRHAGIARARYLITALGEDSANAEIAIIARRAVTIRPFDPLTCFVHVLDPELCEVLRVNEYNAGTLSMRLEFYNVFENGARTILNEHPPFQEGGTAVVRPTRVLLIGLDDFGKRLLITTAKRWWPIYQATGQRLHLTLVDEGAETVLDSYQRRYPALRRSCIFETVPMDVGRIKAANDQELKWLDGAHQSNIYICAPNDSDGLTLALMLRKRLGNDGAPIIVRMNADSRPATLLGQEGRDAGLNNVHTFGFWERTCTKALIKQGSREIMGQAIHEEYCLEQRAMGVLTENSKLSWDALSEEIRESNRFQADHILVKANAIGCGMDTLTDWGSGIGSLSPYEVHKLSRMEHERWCAEKTKNGWRYGKLRDDAMKLHDDLVPWKDLSAEAKYKDISTVKKIPAILARVDLSLSRKDMKLQVAKVLLLDKLFQNEQRKNSMVDVSLFWRDLPTSERTIYLDHAEALVQSLGEIGCEISGQGEVEEEVKVLHPDEIEKATGKFRALMPGGMKGDQAINASRWPEILSKGDLTIYRVDDAMRLVMDDKEAMILAYGEEELDHPFVSR